MIRGGGFLVNEPWCAVAAAPGPRNQLFPSLTIELIQRRINRGMLILPLDQPLVKHFSIAVIGPAPRFQ